MGEEGGLIVRPGEGPLVDIGGLGVHFKVRGERTDGGLAVVEHPMAPRRLVPPHVHQDEAELSYVLSGTFGVRIGGETATVGPGSYVYKPRGVLHTFWNPTDEPALLIEVIWPAGLERFFEALGEAARSAGDGGEFASRRAALAERHHLRLADDWVDELKAAYRLKLLGEP